MTFPRRYQMQKWIPAERAIFDAIQSVEAVGADLLLTDAVILLGKAKDKVADYVDRPEIIPSRSTPPSSQPASEPSLPPLSEMRYMTKEEREEFNELAGYNSLPKAKLVPVFALPDSESPGLTDDERVLLEKYRALTPDCGYHMITAVKGVLVTYPEFNRLQGAASTPDRDTRKYALPPLADSPEGMEGIGPDGEIARAPQRRGHTLGATRKAAGWAYAEGVSREDFLRLAEMAYTVAEEEKPHV